MNVTIFLIWTTFHDKSYLALGGLLCMWAQCVLWVGIIVDIHLHSASIWTAEWRRLVVLASYVSFVIEFFAINQNMGLAPWRNTSWQSTQCKVERIHQVRGFRIDKYNCCWNSIAHSKEARQSRNYNCNFAKETHIWQLDLIYIDTIDTQNAPNWQYRTS